MVDDGLSVADGFYLSLVEQNSALAQILDGSDVVTHEEYGTAALLGDFFHLAEALLLELDITHGEDFVDE